MKSEKFKLLWILRFEICKLQKSKNPKLKEQEVDMSMLIEDFEF